MVKHLVNYQCEVDKGTHITGNSTKGLVSPYPTSKRQKKNGRAPSHKLSFAFMTYRLLLYQTECL